MESCNNTMNEAESSKIEEQVRNINYIHTENVTFVNVRQLFRLYFVSFKFYFFIVRLFICTLLKWMKARYRKFVNVNYIQTVVLR